MRPWPGKAAVPPAENPFGLPRANYKPLAPLALSAAPAAENMETVRGENGLPIFFHGQTAASVADAGTPVTTRALDYLSSLQPAGIANTAAEFVAQSANTDEQGNVHVRLEQVFQGVPVYGGELIAHTQNGAFERLNGRYYPTPQLAGVVPGIPAAEARQKVVEHLGPTNVKTSWTDEERGWIGGAEVTTELVVYHPNRDLNGERLAWHIVTYPNLLRRVVYFVDAQTGAILHHFDHTCEIAPAALTGSHHHEHTAAPTPVAGPVVHPADVVDGPVPATGTDLLNQPRSFGAWMSGSTIYLEDAGRPMFNPGASQMPNSPVGVIVTVDAHNTSPEVSNFDYDIATSNSTSFSSKNAVSTHWNAIQSYEYYRVTHGRKSIDDQNGNIISLFNVSNADGILDGQCVLERQRHVVRQRRPDVHGTGRRPRCGRA
jgi:bacillolysin